MKLFKRIVFFVLIVLAQVHVFAQDNVAADNSNNSNFMTDNGKIMVVMAVVTVIVLGLFIYLASLDRKISKLEKKE